MSLTRIQIIDEALAQAGRPDLVSQGRLWLNLFLEKIYKTQDWAWNIEDSGIVSLTDGGSIPADYWKLKTATLYSTSNVPQNEIIQVRIEEWAELQRGADSATGTPIKVWVDEKNGTFNFWPVPASSYNWQYFYYSLPTIGTADDDTDDGDVPFWKLHDEILIRAVMLKALYYNDDKRYNEGVQELMQEIVQGKMNSADFRAGHNRLRFGKSFRRR